MLADGVSDPLLFLRVFRIDLRDEDYLFGSLDLVEQTECHGPP